MSFSYEFRGPEADGSFVIRFPNIRRGVMVKINTLSMDYVLTLVEKADKAIELTDDVISQAWLEASEPCPLTVFSDVYKSIWVLAVLAKEDQQ